jgi:hypothetical protein
MIKRDYLRIFGNKSKFDCMIFLLSVSVFINLFNIVYYITGRDFAGSGVLGFYAGLFTYVLIFVKFSKSEKFRRLSGWQWEYIPRLNTYRKMGYFEVVEKNNEKAIGESNALYLDSKIKNC